MKTAEIIKLVASILKCDPDVRALCLCGSYGLGAEDIYSDVDFLAVAIGGGSDRFAEQWREIISRAGEVVLWRDRRAEGMRISVITHAWTRIDMTVVTPGQLTCRGPGGVKVLFDRDRICQCLVGHRKLQLSGADRLRWQFDEFIRILGLLPAVLGRAEYHVGVTGLFHLRNLLIELLIEEAKVPNRGGALHLNNLITEDHKLLLSSLPSAVPDRNALIAANLAYAAAYLPRARKAAAMLGIAWPDRFESATWDHLNRELSIDSSCICEISSALTPSKRGLCSGHAG